MPPNIVHWTLWRRKLFHRFGAEKTTKRNKAARLPIRSLVTHWPHRCCGTCGVLGNRYLADRRRRRRNVSPMRALFFSSVFFLHSAIVPSYSGRAESILQGLRVTLMIQFASRFTLKVLGAHARLLWTAFAEVRFFSFSAVPQSHCPSPALLLSLLSGAICFRPFGPLSLFWRPGRTILREVLSCAPVNIRGDIHGYCR